jgi:hypothetical protein
MTYSAFEIRANWIADTLAPDEIGSRFLATLRRFEPLSPAMDNWMLMDMPAAKGVPLAEVAPRMAAFVEHNRVTDTDDAPHPEGGYWLLARGSEVMREDGGPDDVNLTVIAASEWNNEIEFEVGRGDLVNNFEIITYHLFHQVFGVLMETWPCPWGVAYYFGDDPAANKNYKRHTFNLPWLGYLSPALAIGLEPPPELICERTQGGGVILSAVAAVIDQGNLDHTRRADLLEAILIERIGVGASTGLSRPAEHPARVGPY